MLASSRCSVSKRKRSCKRSDSSGGLREAWVESLRALSRGFTSIKESFDIESSVTMLSSCFYYQAKRHFRSKEKQTKRRKKWSWQIICARSITLTGTEKLGLSWLKSCSGAWEIWVLCGVAHILLWECASRSNYLQLEAVSIKMEMTVPLKSYSSKPLTLKKKTAFSQSLPIFTSYVHFLALAFC